MDHPKLDQVDNLRIATESNYNLKSEHSQRGRSESVSGLNDIKRNTP